MITSYITVNNNRTKLVDDFEKPVLSNADLFELAKETIKAYNEDQDAFAELLFYRDNGKLLKKHSIFDQENLQEEVDHMKDLDLYKAYKNLGSKLSRLRKKLKTEASKEVERLICLTSTKREMIKAKLDEKQIL